MQTLQQGVTTDGSALTDRLKIRSQYFASPRPQLSQTQSIPNTAYTDIIQGRLRCLLVTKILILPFQQKMHTQGNKRWWARLADRPRAQNTHYGTSFQPFISLSHAQHRKYKPTRQCQGITMDQCTRYTKLKHFHIHAI